MFCPCINCFHTILCCFIKLSFAYFMSVKMNYTCVGWIVIPYKTNSPHFIAWVITCQNVELVVKPSVPICTAILFTVVQSSTQREFTFVVNKGVFFSFAQCCEQIILQRAYAVKMWNIHIQCLVVSYLTTYSNVQVYCSFQMAM